MAAKNDREQGSKVGLGSDEIERTKLYFENRNYKDALTLYLRLAETEWGKRYYDRIGWMYEFGMGVEKDIQKAEYWYERSAKADCAAGYYSLASMRFRAGRTDEVLVLMEQAGARGYAPALFHLGQMHRFGKGVPVDRVRAYEYFEKAAAQGHLFAQRAIAQRLIRGDRGVWRIPIGLFMVPRILWMGFKLKLTNQGDDRLRRLA